MFFTGYLSNTGSYSVYLPWSGGAFWALLQAYLRDLFYLTLGTRGCSSFRSTERGTLCLFCPYFNSPDSCIHGGWPLYLEWASIGTAIAPQGPGFTLTHSTPALKLLFLAVLESGVFLSSNF